MLGASCMCSLIGVTAVKIQKLQKPVPGLTISNCLPRYSKVCLISKFISNIVVSIIVRLTCFAFLQGEAQSGRVVFRMAPFRKGIYSIEFDSSISLIQAFSICVAFTSYWGSTDLPEANCLSGINAPQEPMLSRNGALKAPMIFQKEGPAKYAPCPPLSPVGRV